MAGASNLRGRLRAGCLALLVAVGLGACESPKTLFVLLDSPDGGGGAITLTNDAGTTVLDTPFQATSADRPDRPPRPPSSIEQDEVARTFAVVLATEPEPTVTFRLYFEFESATLTRESLAALGEVIAAVQAREVPIIAIVGHTDRSGAERANARLGLRRAEAIRTLLVARGADPRIIEVTSHGETNPLIPTADGVYEPRNRRVEITIR